MHSEFAVTRNVEFFETDMAGIMHFSNYFRWMESCEAAFYRSLGLPLAAFVPGRFSAWPRVQATCQYRAPLRFNDVVEVKLFVARLGRRSITYVFHFRKDSVLVAQGEVSVVHVKADRRAKGGMSARPIPPAVRALLQEAPDSAWHHADEDSRQRTRRRRR